MLRRTVLSLAALGLASVGCSTGGSSDPCTNGALDPGETGVDCGGACGLCPGDACTTPAVCASLRCVEEVCAVATCDDGVRNGRELGLDCGGNCAPCAFVPLSCSNQVQDADEEGVDCGGPCPACEVAPSCTDGEMSPGETDVDCGGATDCPRCATTQFCGDAADCLSGTCISGVCRDPACTDELKNGSETDVDCGGLTCDACEPGEGCASAGDCATDRCDDGTCASCSDGVRSGSETDVDCGGDLCDACAQGDGCQVDLDCYAGNCASDHRCGVGYHLKLNPTAEFDSVTYEGEAPFFVTIDQHRTLLIVLREKSGAYPAAGVHEFGGGIQTDFETCSVCLLLIDDLEGPYYFQASGRITVGAGTSADAGQLEMSFEDVILEEVSLDTLTNHSAPVSNGRGARIEDTTVSTPASP